MVSIISHIILDFAQHYKPDFYHELLKMTGNTQDKLLKMFNITRTYRTFIKCSITFNSYGNKLEDSLYN